LVRQNLISHQRWVKFYVAASEKRGYTYTRTKGDKQVGLDLSLETDHAAACFQQTVRLGVLVHQVISTSNIRSTANTQIKVISHPRIPRFLVPLR
jgi:hypothetical protein